MIKEIVCFNFPGFYESIFCSCDDFIDDEDEVKWNLEEVIGKGKIEVCYEYENFEEYKISVSEKFMEYYIDKIIEVLPIYILEDEDFKFEKIDHSVGVDSPKYYNYRTDYSYCEIETNNKTLDMIKEYTLELDEAEEYIKRNFTSCDGFISLISNDFEYWKSLDIEDYEENMLSSLLDMLIDLSDCTGFDEIEQATFYDVDKYYFVYPEVTYIGDDKENDLKILKECDYIKRLNVIIL